MAQSHDRIARVNEILKREIADLIEKRGISRGGVLVSVTKVHASDCLRNAGVYISIFGANAERTAEILRELNKLRPEIQRNVAKHVILKYTPVLHFIHDTNLEEGDKVLSIIKELEENGE
jgi:ribosome-binding factor A